MAFKQVPQVARKISLDRKKRSWVKLTPNPFFSVDALVRNWNVCGFPTQGKLASYNDIYMPTPLAVLFASTTPRREEAVRIYV